MCERLLRPALIAALLALAACAPRVYQRETVILDAPDLDQYTIKYGELEGCLLRRQVPLNYGVARARYAVALRAGTSAQAQAPRIEIVVKGARTLSLRFPDLSEPPVGDVGPQSSRYSVDTAALPQGRLRFDVLSGVELLGSEALTFKRESCTGLGVGG